MNAPERLWRGLARHDWEAVRAQFHPSALIERPATGAKLDVEEFVVDAVQREGEIEILRSVADGKTSVIEARAGSARCVGIYDLHDGRIAGATEYWVS